MIVKNQYKYLTGRGDFLLSIKDTFSLKIAVLNLTIGIFMKFLKNMGMNGYFWDFPGGFLAGFEPEFSRFLLGNWILERLE
jgi:hypothetical protein